MPFRRWMISLLALTFVSALCGAKTKKHQCTADQEFEWTQLEIDEPTPMGRLDHAMATDFDKKLIYLWGGRGSGGFLGDLWVLDPAKLQWQAIETPSTPPPRSGHSLVVERGTGRLLLFGGYRSNDQGGVSILKELWIFSPESGWSREFFKDGPVARAWHATTFFDGKMLIFGGFGEAPLYHLRDLWSLDPATLAWSRLASDGGPLMAGRPAILGLENPFRVVVLGRDGIPKPTIVGRWLLDVEKNRWSTIPSKEQIPVDFGMTNANQVVGRWLVLRPVQNEEDLGNWEVWTASGTKGCVFSDDAEDGPNVWNGISCTPDPTTDPADNTEAWICFGGGRLDRFNGETWRFSITLEADDK